MTVTSGTSIQGAGGGFLAQIQQQQAQRNADQAAQQARALQSRAQAAQSVANRAQESARSLKVEAGQAQSDAASARQGLAAMKSLGEVQTQFADLRQQISDVLANPSPVSTNDVVLPAASPAVINAFGQPTGTLVNVTA